MARGPPEGRADPPPHSCAIAGPGQTPHFPPRWMGRPLPTPRPSTSRGTGPHRVGETRCQGSAWSPRWAERKPIPEAPQTPLPPGCHGSPATLLGGAGSGLGPPGRQPRHPSPWNLARPGLSVLHLGPWVDALKLEKLLLQLLKLPWTKQSPSGPPPSEQAPRVGRLSLA